jgi:hypothetical protein
MANFNFNVIDKKHGNAAFQAVSKHEKEEMQRNQTTLPSSGGAGAGTGVGYDETTKKNLVNFSGYRPASVPSTKKSTGGGGGNPNAPYSAQLNALYDQIMKRKPFQYDLNGDLLYREITDRYTHMGQQAMRDATGTAAGLTGGYGNSYATQVGNQAYQQYLTALNQAIPELHDRAYQVYQGQGDQLMQQYQLAAAHPGNLAALQPSGSSNTADMQSYIELLENALQWSADAAAAAKPSAQSAMWNPNPNINTQAVYNYDDYLKRMMERKG